MNCQDLQELLSAYADGELAQTQCDFIEEHLAGCAGCRAALARYREDGLQLASFRTTANTADIKEAVMTRVKSAARYRQLRRRLQPAFIGVVAVITMSIIAIFMTLPGKPPKEVLAKAFAKTETINSLRFSSTSEVCLPDTKKWITYVYGETEYSGTNRHSKISSDYDYKDGIVNHWTQREYIISDNAVYLWKLTPPIVIPLGWMQETQKENMAMIQQPIDSLKYLGEIKRMPDEKVDDILCLHFKGLVDMDIYITETKPKVEKLAHEMTLQQYQAMGDNLTEEEWAVLWAVREKNYEISMHNLQIEYQYWVGKADSLLYKTICFDTSSPAAKEIMPLSEDHRQTVIYYDFNREITIKPPLDGQGNLLPDWHIQTDPYR